MNDTPKVQNESKQDVIERLWLQSFNDTLYAQGLISETERNRMRIKIKARTPQMRRRKDCPGLTKTHSKRASKSEL